MKKYQLIAIAALLMGLGACKKDKNNAPTGLIMGKWQENKVILHQLTSTTTSHDTTYNSNAFLAGDYYQFNKDSTAVISQTGTYNFGGKQDALQNGAAILSHYKYNVKDTTLNFNPANALLPVTTTPNPFVWVLSIVQLDDTHLVLRGKEVYYTYNANNYPGPNYDNTLTYTAYLTKVK